MAIRVYRYGLLPPTQNADLVRQQMRSAHAYRNTLVEIERGRRAALRVLVAQAGDTTVLEKAVADADMVCETAAKAIKAARSKSRARSETEEMRLALKQAREAKRAAINALRQRRYDTRQTITPEQDRIDELANELTRSARAHCGAFWGTYLLIEDAAQAAKKMPLYDGSEPSDPHFCRWMGEGRVGVQLQGGLMAISAMAGNDTRLRIEPPSLAPIFKRDGITPRRIGKKARQNRILSLRVGSEGRAPIWASWSMIMHRPLPSAAIIKWAVVSLRKIGPREEWSVAITVDEADPTPKTTGGVVAIDIGWRVMGDELRVAVWADDKGNTGELRLDAKLLSALKYADNLRSIRDKNFDLARDALVKWLGAQAQVRAIAVRFDDEQMIVGLEDGREVQMPVVQSAKLQTASVEQREHFQLIGNGVGIHWPDLDEDLSVHALLVPDWLKSMTAHLDMWRSQGRLAAVALKWKENRYTSDESAFGALEAWRVQDHHLWEWETSQRIKSLRRRRELYRVFAADLDASVVVLEDFDLREIAKKGDLVEKAENQTSRSNRQLAAVSELRGAVINVVKRIGAKVVTLDPADTTHECSKCGTIDKFDAAAMIHHACSKCGMIYDQDENAALVLLGRYDKFCERLGDEQPPGIARKDEKKSDTGEVAETRWARAKRLGDEKRARTEAARN